MTTTPTGPEPRSDAATLASVAAVALAVVVTILMVPPVLRALSYDTEGVADLESEFTLLTRKHAIAMSEDQARFDGRSAFFKPLRPPTPEPERRDPEPEPREIVRQPPPPPPPPPSDPTPTRYMGPDVIGYDGLAVYFDRNGLRIPVGGEAEGISVIGPGEQPWSVRLAYRGWEGDVELFEAPPEGFLKGGAARTSAAAERELRPVDPEEAETSPAAIRRASSTPPAAGRNRAVPRDSEAERD